MTTLSNIINLTTLVSSQILQKSELWLISFHFSTENVNYTLFCIWCFLGWWLVVLDYKFLMFRLHLWQASSEGLLHLLLLKCRRLDVVSLFIASVMSLLRCRPGISLADVLPGYCSAFSLPHPYFPFPP